MQNLVVFGGEFVELSEVEYSRNFRIVEHANLKRKPFLAVTGCTVNECLLESIKAGFLNIIKMICESKSCFYTLF